MSESIRYYDRASGELKTETVLGEGLVRWAYQGPTDRFPRALLFRHSGLSRLLGMFYDSRLSRQKIKRVVAELAIDCDEIRDPLGSFASFNAFFIRHLKPGCRPVSAAAQDLASPAEGRVFVYPQLDDHTLIPVKGARVPISQLIGDDTGRFKGGAAMIVRLCPADYHRFHFPCRGQVVYQTTLPGYLHSVNPIALATGTAIFSENKRAVALIDSEMMGRMAYIEVGAFGVGSIVQTYAKDDASVDNLDVDKNAEKGYFKFGGSTVILVFEEGRIQFSDDLIAQSSRGIETFVKVGETVARAL